jgi:hypothetical protein
VLANTTLTAETQIQVNPETDVQTTTNIRESESREITCATPSLEGPAKEENGAPNYKSPLTLYTPEQENGFLPNTAGNNNFVFIEHGNIETEEPPELHFTKRMTTLTEKA